MTTDQNRRKDEISLSANNRLSANRKAKNQKQMPASKLVTLSLWPCLLKQFRR